MYPYSVYHTTKWKEQSEKTDFTDLPKVSVTNCNTMYFEVNDEVFDFQYQFYQNRLPQSHRSRYMVTVTVEIVVDPRTDKKLGETGGKVVTPKLC